MCKRTGSLILRRILVTEEYVYNFSSFEKKNLSFTSIDIFLDYSKNQR